MGIWHTFICNGLKSNGLFQIIYFFFEWRTVGVIQCVAWNGDDVRVDV